MTSNVLPRFGKVAIVDNKHQEVEVVEQLLTANGIPYVYYDYGKLINEGEINKIDGIRLVFLDIRLEDGNEEAKNIYSVLASTIETIIGVNNGPYTIVLWTNEYQLKDEVEDFLMKRLSDEDTTRPTYICALDKKDFLEKPESLFGRVNDELNKNRPLEFLTTLESMTMEIPLSLLKMLLYETGNGIDPSSINKLLMLLASVESTDEIDNVKATKNILSVIADLVKDRYLDLTSNNNRISELAEYMDTMEQIAIHCKMMYEAGLISDYKAQYAGNSLYSFGVSNLTWEGYEYLDKIRDDSIWKKVKDVAKDKGLPLAIDTVKQIASVIISSMTEGAIKAVTGV